MDKLNEAKDKAMGLVEGQGDKIADGVDKATDLIDDKTGGKFTDKLDKVDELADKLREGEGEAPAEEPPAQ
jgi:hypothetical protein